jgi:quercetin dioxygenase-like cupin family protein
MSDALIRRFLPGHRWEGVSLLAYKEEDKTFRSVTRQVLFEGHTDLPVQLRYFEVGPGGHSTLERHDHVHLVWVSRGKGKVYLGGEIRGLFTGDVVVIPPQTWHQFQALGDGALGFHCLVAVDRDKPNRPDDGEWVALTADPAAAAFLRR